MAGPSVLRRPKNFWEWLAVLATASLVLSGSKLACEILAASTDHGKSAVRHFVVSTALDSLAVHRRHR